MSLKNKLHGAAVDSLALTFVQIITTLLGMAVTKLVAANFSLTEYGTYSQALLVVNTTTSITILGLTNATNYFYNNTTDPKKQESYISTIFALQYIVGGVSAIAILALQIPLIHYFENTALLPYLWFSAILPLLHNLLPMQQTLFVSIGKAKTIALRNFIISLIRICIVSIACFITHNLLTITILSLVSQLIQVVYFFVLLGKTRFWVNPFKAKFSLLPEILSFCLPMAVYVMSRALLRDVDKYIIDFFMTPADLALYTNASKQLPFDMITASFVTVLIPIVTRYINSGKLDKAKETFKAYLRLGYLATWILAGGAVVVAKHLMIFLYHEKYLAGLNVFIVYLFVDMIRFANVTTILGGAGKSKTLMYVSLASLAVNFVLNIVSIKWLNMGLLGPALVTLLVSFLTILLMLFFSAKELHCKIVHLFDFKEMTLITLEILVVGSACYALNLWLESLYLHYVAILFIVYGVYVTIMLALNYKKLLCCFKDINRMK